MVELDAILNILTEAQALRANVELEEDDEWKVDEDLEQEDTWVAMATNIQKDKNVKEVLISDVRIMQSINSLHQAEHKCGAQEDKVKLNGMVTIIGNIGLGFPVVTFVVLTGRF